MINTEPRVLHVIQQVSLGGAARAMIAAAKYSSRFGRFQHRVVSLLPPDRRASDLAAEAGVTVIGTDDKLELRRELERADIVLFHFWNTAELHEVLAGELPAMRALIWCHINGEAPPHLLTKELFSIADDIVATSPSTRDLPLLRSAASRQIGMIYAGADFDRLKGIRAKSHVTFNVGYIGLLDFAKMHPDYIAMSAAIEVPGARFLVCGAGKATGILKRQVRQLGAEHRFEFCGYVEDIREVIAQLDVFGYPLCQNNYSTSELVLQEVMYAGVPPVVFPFGGARNFVVHGESVLVVHNAAEYVRAIQYLYDNPGERARLGHNAAARATRHFGAENTAKRFNALYADLLQRPKRNPAADRTDAAKARLPWPGASAFAYSLGDTAGDFRTSLTAPSDAEAIAAERRIERATFALGDSILQYRNHYPDDGYLALWAGLILNNRRRAALAAAEFDRSIKLGCDHWRVFWYLSLAARVAGSSTISERALRVVRQAAPQFVANSDP